MSEHEHFTPPDEVYDNPHSQGEGGTEVPGQIHISVPGVQAEIRTTKGTVASNYLDETMTDSQGNIVDGPLVHLSEGMANENWYKHVISEVKKGNKKAFVLPMLGGLVVIVGASYLLKKEHHRGWKDIRGVANTINKWIHRDKPESAETQLPFPDFNEETDSDQ